MIARSLLAVAACLLPVFASAETRPARDVWVVDGDTFDLLGPERERIRLVAIDAPETSRPNCRAEAEKGAEAKRVAITLLRAGATITVTRTGRTDVYGRTLAELAVDGRDLGAELQARGLAIRWRPGGAAKAERIRHWCGGLP